MRKIIQFVLALGKQAVSSHVHLRRLRVEQCFQITRDFFLHTSRRKENSSQKKGQLTLRAAYCVIFQFPEKGLAVMTMQRSTAMADRVTMDSSPKKPTPQAQITQPATHKYTHVRSISTPIWHLAEGNIRCATLGTKE